MILQCSVVRQLRVDLEIARKSARLPGLFDGNDPRRRGSIVGTSEKPRLVERNATRQRPVNTTLARRAELSTHIMPIMSTPKTSKGPSRGSGRASIKRVQFDYSQKMMILYMTLLAARGICLDGFEASPAAKMTVSVPVYE